MGLAGVDSQTCSALASQLQGSQMEELGGIIAQLEDRFPELKRRLVVALAGYGSEISPVGLGTRTEWDELLRLGCCYAASFQQPAVAAQFSGVEMVTVGTQAVLLHHLVVSNTGAFEMALTDSGGPGFADTTIVPKPLRQVSGAPASTVKIFAGTNAAVLGQVWKRINGVSSLILQGSSFIFESAPATVANIAAWCTTVNAPLDVSFEWAEPPATWPV